MASGAARRKPAGAKGTGGKGSTRTRKARAGKAEPQRRLTWMGLTLLVVGGMLALRLVVNALEPFPVHFDEGQYWAYGQSLDWGYFSKPPLVPAVIRTLTDSLGENLFALRLLSPVSHALVGWLIFLTGARVWDGRTGFWAAAGYTLAPGVGFSSMLASTDPVLLVAWAAALYALVRALAGGATGWWVACGLAMGLGLLSKYTMVAFPLGVAGYLAVTPGVSSRAWRGLGIAAALALALLAPNLWWNATNGFVTLAHVVEDADPGQGYFHLGELAAFLGAQLALIGPVFFLALLPALGMAARRGDDPWLGLLTWQTYVLLGAMCALALVTRANGNWAAPAYVSGSLVAARWLLEGGWWRGLVAQVAIGATAILLLWMAALLYAVDAGRLPAAGDPFRKTRGGPALCGRAIAARDVEGAVVLLSDNRRRLSECMFIGDLGWNQIAVWNPDLRPDNHHELVSTLREEDARRMILLTGKDGATMARQFRSAERLDRGEVATHRDRAERYEIWVVQGFRGYGRP